MEQALRGLNFVAVGPSNKLSILGNIDLCVGNVENLHTLRSKVQQPGQKILIVASDTIHCGVTDQLREVFEAFGLQMWEKVGFRAPYVAVIQNGKLKEYVGRQGARLSVWNSAGNHPAK